MSWHNLVTTSSSRINAIFQAQIYLTDSHLWLEEILSGDPSISIEQVWAGLDNAESQVRTILHGEVSGSDLVINPIEDARLKSVVLQFQSLISDFRSIAHERWESNAGSQAGGPIDQYLDRTFMQAVESARYMTSAIRHRRSLGIEYQEATYYIISLISLMFLIFFIRKAEIMSSNQKALEQRLLFEGLEFENKVEKRTLELRALTRDLSAQKIAMDRHSLISITDQRGVITYANDKFISVSGYTLEELLGNNHRILNSGNKSAEYWRKMYLVISKGGIWHDEVRNRAKNGCYYWVETTISPKYDVDNKLDGYISVRTDITHKKEQEESLRLMAHYDVLTGLPNRVLFADRFRQAIAHSKRSKTMLVICFLDLDKFKPVNDNYGHSVGDDLLIEVAKRIQYIIREEDTVSRQGGDEFALILGDIESIAECEKTLTRIRNGLAKTYQIEGTTHKITASIGATIYPQDDAELDILMRHADQAMYQAKLSGKNSQRLYRTRDDQQVVQKQEKLEELRQALANREFQLYYQPKVNMRTGKVFGVEALIRWFHPKNGMIAPLDFLPMIDGTDLDVQIGGWVISEAVTQLNCWKELGLTLEVSINVSSHHMQSSEFFNQLNRAFDKYPNVDPQHLQLELLESSVFGDIDTIGCIIERCQNEMGIKIALDDFGTGYSSLIHLRNLPADTIKIDQTFVHDMLEESDDLAFVEGVVSLAKIFGKTVIAEGVETAEHGVLLIRIGCDCAQGYGIARPMPAGEIFDWARDYTPDKLWSLWSSSEWDMRNLPLLLAQSEHIKWIQDIFTVLECHDLKLANGEFTDHRQCHFGAWYYGYGMERYGNFPEFWKLQEIHENIHGIGHQIIELLNDDKKKLAMPLARDLRILKRQLFKSFYLLQKQIASSESSD